MFCLFSAPAYRTWNRVPVIVLCPSPCDFLGSDIGVGCQFLLQGIFPTNGSNPGLPHCRQILYHLSHRGSPRILEWVAYPFSKESSWPRNQTRISCIAGRFFTRWATREAHSGILLSHKERNNAICSNFIIREVIVLSEVSQLEKEKYHMILLTCGIKKDANELIYTKNK